LKEGSVMSTARVRRREVAQYYVTAELHNLLGRDTSRSISRLGNRDLWRLLEGLSVTYRLNGVYCSIVSPNLRWYRTTVPVKPLRIHGINETVDEVLRSKTVRYSAVALAEQVAKGAAPGLDEFRSRGPVRYPVIITRKRHQHEQVLDGAHRLVRLILDGHKTVEAYRAVRH
jgi:hypothetical protein